MLGTNDLEGVVFDGWPELERFRDALVAAGARRALLSGSGSTVYGVFDSMRSAESARQALVGEFRAWTLLPTRTVADGIRWVDPC